MTQKDIENYPIIQTLIEEMNEKQLKKIDLELSPEEVYNICGRYDGSSGGERSFKYNGEFYRIMFTIT